MPLDLPAIRRVRLLDGDDEACDRVTVATREVLQVPDLGPEGGSRIAAKNEADWLLPPEDRRTRVAVPSCFKAQSDGHVSTCGSIASRATTASRATRRAGDTVLLWAASPWRAIRL
jgi:hypothetical protein